MKHNLMFVTAFAASLFGASLAALGAVMVDDKGMTLYSFDADVDGVPSCYEGCATKWPPYLGENGAELKEGWTLVDRTDGTKQWAFDGMPLYFFAGDKAAGDTTGDGLGGKWHVIEQKE